MAGNSAPQAGATAGPRTRPLARKAPSSPPARPPARMQRTTLALALAHRMQCEVLGGVSKESARTLDAVAAQEFGETSARPSVPPRRIKVGSKLVREWRGVVHEVAVAEDGFAWNGARYRSLSAIARAITGTRWNGLVFFGLKTAKRSNSAPSLQDSTIVEAKRV